jgi:hypothetical protein
MLTVLPADDIEVGIQYIRNLIDEKGKKGAWDHFWSYFKKVWMRKSDSFKERGTYLISSWNISHLIDQKGKCSLSLSLSQLP